MYRLKLNINGYAQHGKDTIADLFVERHGFKKVSASMVYAEDIRNEQYLGPYATVEDCYEDRVNHRQAWYEFICKKLEENPHYYIDKILETGDIYVGQRNPIIFEKTKDAFDYTIWVDASGRGMPKESYNSCKMSPDTPHDFYIDNTKQDWAIEQVDFIMALINNKRNACNAYS